MKYVLFQLLIMYMFSVFSSRAQEGEKLYVGTFTTDESEGIYLCHFNPTSGELSHATTFKGIDNPNFLKISPDKNFLYAATRPPQSINTSGGYINAYKIEKNGQLHFLNKQISHGDDPCHIDISPDGQFVATATYGGGSVSLYPVTNNGSLSPASSTIVFKGSGPNKARQSKPHAHSIKFSPADNQVFSADLGTDRLNIFELENNILSTAKQEFVKTGAGAGPRHFTFFPGEKFIYAINELNSTITCLRHKNNVWEEFQTISTVPDDFSGENYCADIHVSADGKFLYGSNRGHNSIAVFKINPTSKKIERMATVPSQGEWPRNFTLTKNGKYLLVANQHSSNIAVFKINSETGIPSFTGKELKVPAPVCLEFLNY
jgi:6-phosphogluconolactonase